MRVVVAGLALTLWTPVMRQARALALGTAALLALWLASGLPT